MVETLDLFDVTDSSDDEGKIDESKVHYKETRKSTLNATAASISRSVKRKRYEKADGKGKYVVPAKEKAEEKLKRKIDKDRQEKLQKKNRGNNKKGDHKTRRTHTAGTKVMEVSIPTQQDTKKYGYNRHARLAAHEQVPYNKSFAKKDWWFLPKPPELGGSAEEKLTLRVSLRANGPLLIRYFNVQSASEATMRGEEVQPPTKPPARIPVKNSAFQHVLFKQEGGIPSLPQRRNSSESASSNATTLSSSSSSSVKDSAPSPSPKKIPHNYSLDKDRDDQFPQLKEWYPHDAEEYILSGTEQELAWLFEESHHCFRGVQETTLDWGFVWEYASPTLKVELRKFEDTDDKGKYNRLVRWKDSLVCSRMKIVCSHFRYLLNIGFRRLHMKRVVALLRLVQPKNILGDREYPIADYAGAAKLSYSYLSDWQKKSRAAAVARAQRQTRDEQKRTSNVV